jgi:hypothetical protein
MSGSRTSRTIVPSVSITRKSGVSVDMSNSPSECSTQYKSTGPLGASGARTKIGVWIDQVSVVRRTKITKPSDRSMYRYELVGLGPPVTIAISLPAAAAAIP